jgi:AraC family transcriptional regulator, transcriptional activator of pobA
MYKNIPTFNIKSLSGQSTENPEVFFADHSNSNNLTLNIPYRSNYFGIGVCEDGDAVLKANLETYKIEKSSIITMSPEIIKEWIHFTADYKVSAVFFTKEFFIKNSIDKNFLDRFDFFECNAQHVTRFNHQQTHSITTHLKKIKEKINSSHPYKHEIIRSLITILLYEIAPIYNKHYFPSIHKQTRSEQIAFEFKKLVSLHFTKERSVTYYAELLFLSPKHLTEIIKIQTGKSAKERIDELVILESKVLLQDQGLTIARIADSLNFNDQSTFGKFFKNLTGVSPIAYRQNLL